MLGQHLAAFAAQFCHIHDAIQQHVSHQTFLTRSILTHHHHGFLDGIQTGQASFHLAQLDTETTHFHLIIGAT